MNRRPATAEDMKPGAIVFKGNGKVEWVVVGEHRVFNGAAYSTRYEVKQVTTSGKSKNGFFLLKYFTVAA